MNKFVNAPSNWRQRAFGALESLIPSAQIEDTIVISGTGRSGSTWVGELIRSLDGYKYLNEPFMHTPFRTRTYVDPNNDSYEELHEYMSEILQGRARRSWRWTFESYTSLGRINELIKNNKVAVKLTRGLRSTRWISNTFNVRETFLLMRHPCAVISSMLRHGGWSRNILNEMGDTVEKQVCGNYLPESIKKEFLSKIKKADKRYEVLAHIWALDYFIALIYDNRKYPWVLIPYERLISKEEEEINRILKSIGEEKSKNVIERLKLASASASKSYNTHNRQKQLTKWRNHLSLSQSERIIDIVENYGIDWYTLEPEPDYKRINHLQHSKSMW